MNSYPDVTKVKYTRGQVRLTIDGRSVYYSPAEALELAASLTAAAKAPTEQPTTPPASIFDLVKEQS